MATFVLVHGSWHGSWCWYKVKELLEKEGHQVRAVDLPGLEQKPAADITLQDYVDCVLREIDDLPGEITLVGHSRGGIVISQAAEHRPEKIKKLVYLTAYLIPPNQSMLAIALSDVNSLIGPNLEFNELEGWHRLKGEVLKETLYGDCSEEDFNLAVASLRLEPNGPLVTPLNLTEENYGRIPRVYISCLKDRGLTPELQKKMYMALACEKVIEMDTSHSPFFSRPDELVSHLIGI
jgi:pimeloyl-ACP methyl ester carboxylesterase